RSAFPDAQATIEQLIAEGDRVAFRFVLQGTHQGTFAGVAPTGKLVRLRGTDVVRIADGKLIELWSSQDTLHWALQLGLVTWVADASSASGGHNQGKCTPCEWATTSIASSSSALVRSSWGRQPSSTMPGRRPAVRCARGASASSWSPPPPPRS